MRMWCKLLVVHVRWWWWTMGMMDNGDDGQWWWWTMVMMDIGDDGQYWWCTMVMIDNGDDGYVGNINLYSSFLMTLRSWKMFLFSGGLEKVLMLLLWIPMLSGIRIAGHCLHCPLHIRTIRPRWLEQNWEHLPLILLCPSFQKNINSRTGKTLKWPSPELIQ